MDAIKKKMQSMKVEKDAALDRADVCEQVRFQRIKVFKVFRKIFCEEKIVD